MGLGSTFKKFGSSSLGKALGMNDSYGAMTDPIGFLTGQNAAEAQNEAQIRFWNMQNEYNKPINQMARFDEAGLNPNLIYTQGNAGNAGSVGSAASGETGSSTLSKVASTVQAIYGLKGMKADIANKYAQNANMREQNSLLGTQTSYTAEQARRMALENDYFEEHGQWPSAEGGVVKDLKSIFNYLPLESLAEALGSARGKFDLLFAPKVRARVPRGRLLTRQDSPLFR